ncbi:MAG: FxsA family protein [Pseudomonadota bacterium]
MPLFIALVLIPIIEIGLFIEVGGALGLWPTLGIVVLTAAIGTWLLRTQGIGVLQELQTKLQHGEDPSATLANGAMILVAGVVLLTPGFFTDALGFLLLIPPVRAALIRAAAHRVVMRGVHMRAGFATGGMGTGPGAGPGMHAGMNQGMGRRPAAGRGATIDGQFERVEDEAAPGESTDGDAASTSTDPRPHERLDRP